MTLMIDDESVVDLIASTGIRDHDARRNTNPFRIPPSAEVFGSREREHRRAQSRRDDMRKMTLVQRTDLLKPSVPPCSVHGNRDRTQSALDKNSTLARQQEQQKRERQQRMGDFIQQKREIFLVQMLIDRKNKEIQKINRSIANEEADLIDSENKVKELSNQYKVMTAQIESNLAHARKSTESATRKRVELIKSLKRSTQAVAIMKSEMTKDEELLESYHDYENFLKMLAPDNFKEDIFGYFSSPKVLLNEMAEFEKENLLMIQMCQYLESNLDRNLSKIDQEIAAADENYSDINEKFDIFKKKYVSQDFPDNVVQKCTSDSEKLDLQLKQLTELIQHVHSKCFRKESNFNAITMLERIENELEMMYKKIEIIDPKFVSDKQAVKDRERREHQRIKKQEKQALDQQHKMEQAIERANKPIKKKTGRPMCPRSIPVKREHKNDASLKAKLEEQARIEKLLFGTSED